MEKDVLIEDDEVLEEGDQPDAVDVDPDEFFAKNAIRIVYQTNNFLLPQVRDLIERGEAINLRPEYQRRLRWSNKQKSKLVESMLLNIPVPPVFFFESDAARYEVMDGQQRLNAIKEFFAGDFALSGLEVLSPLNGLRYGRCPPRIKRALDRSTISAIILLLESQPENPDAAELGLKDIRRFVFDRLNTGGRKLNAQEIRNALNPGPLNQAIIEISRSNLFADTFGIPRYTEADPNDYYENPTRQKNSLYASMKDCELVLRFVALRDPDNIRGSMSKMLDRAMEKTLTEQEAQLLKVDFGERLALLSELFDSDPFLLPPDAKGRRRISAAMFDSAMVAIDRLWPQRANIVADKVGVQARLQAAFEIEEELEKLTGRGNTAEAVRDRINLFQNIFAPRLA